VNRFVCILVAALGCWPILAAAQLKVATLHPLMADLARHVGGDLVEVVELLPPGGNPHAFEPSPRDLARAADARLILASGKGLELYLHKLRGGLGPGQEIFEVGRKVPSLKVTVGSVFLCCPAHSTGSLDPHWWHSISNMDRATRYLAAEFARVDPENKKRYADQASAHRKQLDVLEDWCKTELKKVPRDRRYLATAHAAFGYFCKEFGFQAVPVQGLAKEDDPSPRYLIDTIDIIKRQKIAAVFPEVQANPKVLTALVRETSARLGDPLVADGTAKGAASSYEGMMRHNVSAIVKALGQAQ